MYANTSLYLTGKFKYDIIFIGLELSGVHSSTALNRMHFTGITFMAWKLQNDSVIDAVFAIFLNCFQICQLSREITLFQNRYTKTEPNPETLYPALNYILCVILPKRYKFLTFFSFGRILASNW